MKKKSGYIKDITKMVQEAHGQVPRYLETMIEKTAMDMVLLNRISKAIEDADQLYEYNQGSMGQIKMEVNPLITQYEKVSSRVTDDLYNLGLTYRKQAAKTEASDPKSNEGASGLAEILSKKRGGAPC